MPRYVEPRRCVIIESLLIDRYMTDYDFTRVEYVVVDAPPTVAYEAARDIDLAAVHTPLMDTVMWLRGLPQRFRKDKATPTVSSMTPDDLGTDESEWLLLAENPGREVVFGVVGRFGRPKVTWRGVDDFATFEEPGYGKIAANFAVQPCGETRTLLTYEARTKLTDPQTRGRFRRYWGSLAPGVGVVLATTLRAAKIEAEARARRPLVETA